MQNSRFLAVISSHVEPPAPTAGALREVLAINSLVEVGHVSAALWGQRSAVDIHERRIRPSEIGREVWHRSHRAGVGSTTATAATAATTATRTSGTSGTAAGQGAELMDARDYRLRLRRGLY
jgi:hypothetical protein